jgi:hypothetical protein
MISEEQMKMRAAFPVGCWVRKTLHVGGPPDVQILSQVIGYAEHQLSPVVNSPGQGINLLQESSAAKVDIELFQEPR